MPTTSFLETVTVIETREVAKGTFVTKVKAPSIARNVKAGQFVMVSFPESTDPLLPRAFSVCDAFEDSVSLLYVAVGKGTRRISKLLPGDPMVFNGPLGKGFPNMSGQKTFHVVVGGSGAALIPILDRTAKSRGASINFYYGARTGSQLVKFDGVENVNHATDDGSEGFHGNVVELLKKKIDGDSSGVVFACGPTPMLVALQREVGVSVETYLSVETPMACGMGLCQGCPVRNAGDGDYYLACKDGPVFRSTEISFEMKP